MPFYTYRCDNCGVQFDRQQRFEDSPLVRCPECGKKALKRVYRPVGIVFRGSGFYVTDNRGGSNASSSSKKAESEAVPSNGPSSSESKAEDKS